MALGAAVPPEWSPVLVYFWHHSDSLFYGLDRSCEGRQESAAFAEGTRFRHGG